MLGFKSALTALVLVGSAHGAASAQSAADASCDAREAVFYFAPGAQDLDAFGQAAAARFAESAKACAIARVEIVGHADAVGDANANAVLSLARAEAASDALVDAGLSPDRIELEAVGERDAISKAGDARPMARRVVVTLVTVGADTDIG